MNNFHSKTQPLSIETFTVKDRLVNISGLEGYTVFVASTNLCCDSTETLTNKRETNGHGFVQIKFHL